MKIVLKGARLEGLELILSGLLAPAVGFCLPGQKPDAWPIEPTLSVDADVADDLQPGDTVTLYDPDNTPLADLDLTGVATSEGGQGWLAGSLTALRAPEHGVARAARFHPGDTLVGHLVALFRDRASAADVLRIALTADGRPIDLVVEGSPDEGRSSRVLRDLEACAEQLPLCRVRYIPDIAFGSDVSDDIARQILDARGASDVFDLRPAVSDSRGSDGAVILFTGLSGAGKSTIARAVAERISAGGEAHAVLLDGDHVRTELASELGFGRSDRETNLLRLAWVAARVAEAGGIAVCAPIAPFEVTRQGMRAKVEPESPFIVVYVSTPLAIAEQRDRKGLYEKARAGLIPDFTGIDSPYEEPLDADVIVDTSRRSVEECAAQVLAVLSTRLDLPNSRT